MNSALNIQNLQAVLPPSNIARPGAITKSSKIKKVQTSTKGLDDGQNQQQALTAGEIYRSVLRDYPDVLDVNQVGIILGVSTKTIYRLLNEGSLASLKVGRAFKIPKLYVMQYIKVLDQAEQR